MSHSHHSGPISAYPFYHAIVPPSTPLTELQNWRRSGRWRASVRARDLAHCGEHMLRLKEVRKGAGLGLSIPCGIVRSVAAASGKSNAGATLFIDLPVVGLTSRPKVKDAENSGALTFAKCLHGHRSKGRDRPEVPVASGRSCRRLMEPGRPMACSYLCPAGCETRVGRRRTRQPCG